MPMSRRPRRDWLGSSTSAFLTTRSNLSSGPMAARAGTPAAAASANDPAAARKSRREACMSSPPRWSIWPCSILSAGPKPCTLIVTRFPCRGNGLRGDDVRAQFWGTRGSIAKPGPSTARYGGNTSCVEVRSAGGAVLVLDCGTGGHALGQALMAARAGSRGHLLISHTHWDHIQGIPFFAPLFVPGSEWDIYAPRGFGQTLRDTLAGQMQYSYFPVGIEQLGATIRYHELVEGRLRIDDIEVTSRYLNHPALTLGYRIEADGVAMVYACDHE